MSLVVREDVSARAEERDAGLLREVRHAAGNLVHRMQYWTALLAQESLGAKGEEALLELRASIDGLHRLIGCTMELLRPLPVRLVGLRAGDLVRAVGVRLGADCEAALAALPQDAEVSVDVAVLDRALAILADLFAVRSAARELRLERDVRAATFAVVIPCPPQAEHAADEAVQADVALALAGKLLADIGCSLDATATELRLSVSLSRSCEPHARSMASPLDPCER